jgi:hypothetical protein
MNQIKVTNTKTLVGKDSIIAKGESNDCMVYATAAAFDLDYDQAHQHVKHRFSRKDKKGASTLGIIKGMQEMVDLRENLNGKFVREIISQPYKKYHLHGRDVNRKNRVSTFIKEHSQGTYLILTSRHALVAREGVMLDNVPGGSGKAFVRRAFKVEPVITFQP